jgi:hypothetical protein
LVDDFMAKALAVRVQAGTEEVDVSDAIEDVPVSKSMNTDASQSVHAIVTPAAIVPSRAESRATAELVAMPGRGSPGDISKGASEEPPSYASRNWRAEAWERERARELRAVERRTDVASRRRSRS